MNRKSPVQNASVAHSEACERNKSFILRELRDAFSGVKSALEVGSGTGQHVTYFAQELPGIQWQPTDTGEFLPGLIARLAAEAPANVADPLDLDVRMDPWPVEPTQGVFSANTLHYMSKDCAEAFFRGIGQVLMLNGVLVIYGPFRYGGEFTSPSNARFDEWLKASDPVRGVRDFEWINELAAAQGLELVRDENMPANNQLLVWCRRTGA